MVPKERYQFQWDMYGALAAVERLIEDDADDRVRCFLDYALTTFKSGAMVRNFIVRLITFNLLDLRLTLDCVLPIRIF